MQQNKDSEMQQHTAALEARFREIGMLTKSLIETQAELEQERAAHAETRRALEAAEFASRSYYEVVESTSWRLTAPLRTVMGKLRR
ncbi:MAG: hypothetical protein AB8B82_15420 [Roseovarius sp.]